MAPVPIIRFSERSLRSPASVHKIEEEAVTMTMANRPRLSRWAEAKNKRNDAGRQ